MDTEDPYRNLTFDMLQIIFYGYVGFKKVNDQVGITINFYSPQSTRRSWVGKTDPASILRQQLEGALRTNEPQINNSSISNSMHVHYVSTR